MCIAPYRVSPERHVAVRIEDAVEPRPTRDGGGGRGRRGLSPHGQQRRPLCGHLVRLLLILEVSFIVIHTVSNLFFNLNSFLFTLLVCLRWWGKPGKRRFFIHTTSVWMMMHACTLYCTYMRMVLITNFFSIDDSDDEGKK